MLTCILGAFLEWSDAQIRLTLDRWVELPQVHSVFEDRDFVLHFTHHVTWMAALDGSETFRKTFVLSHQTPSQTQYRVRWAGTGAQAELPSLLPSKQCTLRPLAFTSQAAPRRRLERVLLPVDVWQVAWGMVMSTANWRELPSSTRALP